MADIILVIAFVAMAIAGFFLMARLDKFLDENFNREKSDGQKEAIQPYITIKSEDDKQKISDEIEKFRQKHSCTCVIICDPSEIDYIDLCNLYET